MKKENQEGENRFHWSGVNKWELLAVATFEERAASNWVMKMIVQIGGAEMGKPSWKLICAT